MATFLWRGAIGPFLKRPSTWALFVAWLVLGGLGPIATGGAHGHGANAHGSGLYDVAFTALPVASWLAVLALAPQRPLLARSPLRVRLATSLSAAFLLACALLVVAAPWIDLGRPVGSNGLFRLGVFFLACVLWGEVVSATPRLLPLVGWIHAAGIAVILGSGYAAPSQLTAFPATVALILPILGLSLALFLQAPARSLHR